MKDISDDELKAEIKEFRVAVLDCFGIIPVCCDGRLAENKEKHNELAEKLNELLLKVK